MRVFTIKASRKKLFAVLMLATAIFVVVVAFLSSHSAKNVVSQIENVNAHNESERIAFLSQFGWQVNEEPTEIREVIIPEQFNEVYNNYNEIQIKQGFDLSKYKGCTVKRWTYTVVNYPNYENSQVVLANLLIYDGRVIGGDICSTELDGFMHTFKMEK